MGRSIDKRCEEKQTRATGEGRTVCEQRTCIGIQGSKNRKRTIEWSCKVHVDYNDNILNKETVIEIAEIAGEQVGVGDWRPKYGRFSVKVI